MDALMLPGSRRKSVGLAYVLLALFGLFGLHRLYLGRSLSGAGMAAITLLSIPLIWSGLGTKRQARYASRPWVVRRLTLRAPRMGAAPAHVLWRLSQMKRRCARSPKRPRCSLPRSRC